MSYEARMELSWPLTEEQRDALLDADLDHTEAIFFLTKRGKTVRYVKGDGWNSVKDRLPETRLVEDGGDSWKASGDVLCYGDGEIRIGYYEDDLDGRTWWNDREHGEGIPVTHWMELPAGPGEDDDNGGP